MKNIIKYFALAVVILGFSANAFGQVSATANATASIITPIAITRITHMNFGNIASGQTLGTVVLSTAGERGAFGGVTLPISIGTVAAASFKVTGEANFAYSISTIEAITVSSSGSFDMAVNTFTTNPDSDGVLDALGGQIISVGATLHVAANQSAGTYTSTTPFTVTVNYN